MPRFKPAHETYRVHQRAALSGATRTGGASLEWDVSGDCLSPVFRTLEGRKQWDLFPKTRNALARTSRSDVGYQHETNFTDLWVRCRKCENCLAAKAMHWAARGTTEVRLAARTWFCTYTMPADQHVFYEYKFGPRARAEQRKELTLMFKRMRRAQRRFRYLLVEEDHKSGFPHWHLLIHEPHAGVFTSRELAGNRFERLAPKWWPHGFANARLVPDGTAASRVPWYVTKYVANDAKSRIRASIGYGLSQ